MSFCIDTWIGHNRNWINKKYQLIRWMAVDLVTNMVTYFVTRCIYEIKDEDWTAGIGNFQRNCQGW